MATKAKKTAKKTSGKTKPSAKVSCKCPMCEQELVSQCRETLVCQPCEIKLKQCPTCGRLYQSDLKSCPTCETCR